MHSKVASEQKKYKMFDRERTANIFLKDLSIDGIRNGIQNKPGQNNLNVKFINVVNLYHSYKIKVQDLEYIDVDEKTLEKYKIMKNDIFFTRSSLRVEGIAHCNILLDEPQNMIFDDHIMRIRPNPEIVNPYYLKLYCLTPKARKFFMRKSKTGTMTTIAQDDIGTLLVSVPKKEIQKRIATFFILIEERILKQQEKIEKLEQFKKGMMQKVFSQELRFKDENGGEFQEWEYTTIGKEIEVGSCIRVHQKDWKTAGVPFYRARDIVAMKKGLLPEPLFISQEDYEVRVNKNGRVQKGDVMVTGVGTIGVPFLIREQMEVYFKDGNVIWLKNNNKLYGEFLYYYMLCDTVQKYIKTTSGLGTVSTYTIESAKKTPLMLPSEEEQGKIANYLSSIYRKVEKEREKLKGLEEQKKGLMQGMFV